MAEPLVRAYINTSVTGKPGQWPLEWLAAEWVRQPFPRAVSLGCGDGPLERDLLRKGICGSILGIDIAHEALQLAAAQAEAANLRGVEYRRLDLSTCTLPAASFEAAFFHQSLHHVAGLEHCLDQVAGALVPDGFLYLDEYVGPSRTEWRKADLAAAQAVFSELPQALRRGERLPAPVDWRDPSEAIRSSAILPAVMERFEVLRRRDYGGNLLALIYPLLRLADVSQETRDGLLEHLIAAERKLLAAGVPSYCTVVIARPRA